MGVSNKLRAMFPTVYESVSAYTKAADTDGKYIKSDVFPIQWGVLQGDITSPLYFILALDLILHRYDARTDKGVTFGSLLVHTLDYTDDAALSDYGDKAGVKRASERVTEIVEDTKRDTDMTINKTKTKVMYVRAQDPISATSNEETLKVCKFVCPHLDCRFRFRTKGRMLVHKGKCTQAKEYELERILDCKGEVYARQYLVKWKDYPEEFNTWEPHSNFHPGSIKDFELANGHYVADWQFRCPICDLPCKSARGVQIHHTKYHGPKRTQVFKNRLADFTVREQKWVAQQEARPVVHCEGKPLENVFKFKYLGSIFAADG